jgi:hypothetical protein
MSLRLSLKWAIILVVIFGVLLMGIPLVRGDYSKAGGAFAQWAIMSIIILLIGTWDEYTATKEDKK